MSGYDISNVPFKGKSQLNLSQGWSIQLLISARLSSKQIYLFERWGQTMVMGWGNTGAKKRDMAGSFLLNEQYREIYEENKAIYS